MPPQPAINQGPVAEQVPVEEDLAVAGLLGVDPGALCRGRGYTEQLRQPRGLTWRVRGCATKVVDSGNAIPAQTVKNLHKRASATGENRFPGPGDQEIVEIGILDEGGQALLDTLVRPVRRQKWPDAQRVHDIAPTLDELWPRVTQQGGD